MPERAGFQCAIGKEYPVLHSDSTKTPLNAEDREEIRRLVDMVMTDGHPDRYSGKRGTSRHKGKIWLDVRFENQNDKPTQIYTNDIGLNGIGFWLRKSVEPGKCLYVRDASDSDAHPWLRIRITHCKNGLKGFLVGGEFTSKTD